MELAETLSEYIRACFTGIWIVSDEHDEALLEIARLCREQSWALAAWDISVGLSTGAVDTGESPAAELADPLAALRAINALATPDGAAVLVLKNFHRFLQSPEVIQEVTRQIARGKQNRTFLVVLAPTVQLPPELERLFVCIDHPLPSRAQLEQIARSVATEPGELPEEPEFSQVIDAACGLTRYEAEGAASLSLVRQRRVEPRSIWSLKAQMLKRNGLLTLHHGNDSFACLGGLDHLKTFCTRAMRRQGQSNPLKRPRGVMLLSPPGCGKSQFAKSLGNETGRPTLILDVGALMGSLVGQTESNVRRALKIADAMAPCVLMADEIEKALSGVASSGQSDSGVSARLFGTLLTWLSDHESDVFVVCTANAIDMLPPEMARAERFDGVFFLDLPGDAHKAQIWDIWLQAFELDTGQPRPDTTNWTGAEIRACCRLAALLECSLIEASQNIVPVAVTASESVERLRSWASGRCLSADAPGIYFRGGKHRANGRQVLRGPAHN